VVLSKDEVLARVATRPEVPMEPVQCPDLGGEVLVRSITGPIRNRLEAGYAAITEGADGSVMDDVIPALLSACVVDERGHPYLTRNMARQFWENYPMDAFRIRDKAVELAGMSRADVEELTEAFD